MNAKNKKISYGNVELTENETALKGAKIRVTMMIDYDLVQAYKKIALESGAKYQTLMNLKLREAIEGQQGTQDLLSRVIRLEDHLFRKKKKSLSQIVKERESEPTIPHSKFWKKATR